MVDQPEAQTLGNLALQILKLVIGEFDNLAALYVDQVIVVSVKPTTQVARLKHVKGLTDEQAWARVRAQLPMDQKLPFADWVIDGEASLAATEARVREIWQALTALPPEDRAPDPA